MYQDILQRIEGVGIFPVISLLLFVSLFSVVLATVLRMDRTRADRLAALPMDTETPRAASKG